MRVDAYLNSMREFPLGTLDMLTSGGPTIVLAPHPDDESLGMGGTIAKLTENGQPVEIVVMTDGSGSHQRSKSYPREHLVALRKNEIRKAAAVLGVGSEKITFLNFPDAAMPTEGIAHDKAVETMVQLVQCTGAKSLFSAWKYDPHCDHLATALMAERIKQHVPQLAVWYYPIWGWHLDPSDQRDFPEPLGYRLDISDMLARKKRAVQAHASQMTGLIADDPTGFRFNETTIAPFLTDHEYFIRG